MYDFIRERFGAEKSLEIMELLEFISNSRKGEDFRDDLRNGTIKSERFSWMSFGD